MNMCSPAILQLIIDFVLLLAVIFLLWRLNFNLKKSHNKSHREMLDSFRALKEESQAESERFLEALEKSRLALKEIALELDIKEKRVRSLLGKTNEAAMDGFETTSAAANPDDKYARVVEMIKNGHTRQQAALESGIPEAEIDLIVELYRIKNEIS